MRARNEQDIIVEGLFSQSHRALENADLFAQGSRYEAEQLNRAFEYAMVGHVVLVNEATETPVIFKDFKQI